MFERARRALARLIAPRPGRGGARQYAAARSNRLTNGFGSGGNTSADAELHAGLTQLRARSRQMVRDSAYAKRARAIVVNNVIGTGIGLQAQVMTTRDALNQRVNADIEAAWGEWMQAARCHTGGALHFHDLERAALGQVFEAGECFIRKHYDTFGDSRIPLALELIEPERMADEFSSPGPEVAGADVRMGVEVDAFGRAIAYWIRQRHPGDLRAPSGATDRFERVPAADVFHLRLVDRWPQTRGEPWMHSILRKVDDMNEVTGSEVAAVRASSMYFATIKTPDDDMPHADTRESDGQGVMNIEPLTIQELKPGEELDFHAPNRPNAALDAFLRHMLREVAAGVGVSYESLSRDYSQSNYSSSRLALLDDRDGWKALQQWWVRNFRQPLHRAWLQQAVLAGAVPSLSASLYASDMPRYEAVTFKPRGWSWVDPTKEVEAYKEAVKAGFMTITDVIAATGGGLDIEDVIQTRRRELDMLDEAEIEVDTTVQEPPEPAPAQAAADTGDAQDPPDTADRSVHLNVAPVIHMPERSITVEAARIEVPAPVVHMRSPNVHVEAPVIHVPAPQVHVEPAAVRVEVPAPVVNVTAPAVHIEPTVVPAPVVNVEAAQVRVEPATVNVAAPEVHVAAPQVTVVNEHTDTEQTVETDDAGNIQRVVTRAISTQRH